MNSPKNAFGPDPNPYEPPGASLDRFRGHRDYPPAEKKAIAITHDLTDAELKRFVNFDVYYDPKPMLGFIPQWVVLTLLSMGGGAFTGLATAKSNGAALFGGIVAPVVVLAALDLTAAIRRRNARELGLCEDRTVTISPHGLSVRIPTAQPTTMTAIGPMSLAWTDVRLISANEVDVTFWMRPTLNDIEGRARVVVPLRAFGTAAEAVGFENAARAWHAEATGGDAYWWSDDDR